MTTGDQLLPINKRRTIARMHRRGDKQTEIAHALGCTPAIINKHVRLFHTDPSYFSNLSREEYEARRGSAGSGSSGSAGADGWRASFNHPLRDFAISTYPSGGSMTSASSSSSALDRGRRSGSGSASTGDTSLSPVSFGSGAGSASGFGPGPAALGSRQEEAKRERWRQQRHLTLREQQARLEFARAHAGWTADDWKSVIFSGETIFYAGQWGDRYELVREHADGRIERLAPAKPADEEEGEEETAAEKYASIAIVFWGGLCGNVQVGPYISRPEDKPLTKDDYIKLLGKHVQPAMSAGEAVMFEHTAAPIHRAAKVSDWLDERDIPFILWPAKSHDISIMDDVWAEMRRRLHEDYQYGTIKTRDWVAAALERVWADMSNSFIQGLFEGMPGKMKALIESGGMTTKM